MSRLAIDVTYLAHWQGKLTGIPRVINELAVRYSEDAQVVFVVWNNDTQSFLEVDIGLTLKNRGVSLHYLPDGAQKKQSKALNVTGRGMRKLKNKYSAPIPNRVITPLLSQTSFKEYTAQSGDKLLIAMGEWHNDSYIQTVTRFADQGVRLIQICYDVLPLVQPQYSGHSTGSLNNYNSAVMPKCELILAISEHTKKDLAAWLKSKKLHTPAIEVFRLGDDFKKSALQKPTDENFLHATKRSKDFVLCVGTIEARKNHTLLYYVYKLAKQRGATLPPLVIVGRRGWKTDDLFELITTDPDTREQITILQNATDEELAWLYDNALFSVYPSFYEGWGLPIAESISHGLPCVASNTSSMPEIAGDLIPYFSPVSSDEALSAMIAMSDAKNRAAAQKKIATYTPTTWSDTFKQIAHYVEEL